MSTFESALTRFPHHVQANINYQLSLLEKEDTAAEDVSSSAERSQSSSGRSQSSSGRSQSSSGRSQSSAERYKSFVVANRANYSNILFYPEFFKNERRSIDMQIFHQKHDIVVRKGLKCSHCKSTNTVTREVQTRSGDEAKTIIVYCNDCHRKTVF